MHNAVPAPNAREFIRRKWPAIVHSLPSLIFVLIWTGVTSLFVLCAVRLSLIYFMHVMQVHLTRKTQTHTRLVLLQRARVLSLGKSGRCALICTRRCRGLLL